MHKVQFIFAIHNHQPVGNFDSVAEEAYRKSYFPFINVLEQHPSIKITLHYTGILYHFFEQHHPEFIEKIKKLVSDGRAEILSGGFYEPVLAVLPDEDKIGQVSMLNEYIRHKLGYQPRGMWLAERVWEPHLPGSLAQVGINHVVVDDFHFKMAGLHDDELDGYYLTEEQDNMVRIFPGNENLRYLIPFHPPEETIEALSRLKSTERRRLLVMADDGEKFGVWPETYHSVYEEGWLDKFFTLLEQNHDWLETTTFSEYMDKELPRGKIYLPAASYMEMGEWSLPTRAMKEYEAALEKVRKTPDFSGLRPFIKGGIWRNFLAKYPESNHMHKRMLMASRKVRRVIAEAEEGGQGGASRLSVMKDHLYQAQCNDAYWHGIFGGLYLPHLRSGIYEHIIRAEYLADGVLNNGGDGKPGWLEIETGDFDRDGSEEIMLNSDMLNLFIDPREGGRITEIDWKPGSFNLTNTLTRRPEGYHDKIACVEDGTCEVKTIHDRISAKEQGLENYLNYDLYKRGSLIDHFLEAGATLNDFMSSRYSDAGDFVLGGYEAASKKADVSASVVLSRTGRVSGIAVRIRKEISLGIGQSSFAIRYKVENLDDRELIALFGTEFNFSLLAGNAHDRYYDIPGHVLEQRQLASTGETDNVSRVRLVDEWLNLKISLDLDSPATIWRAPVETVSQSEGGFERVYQSSMVMPAWRLSLGGGKVWETAITVNIGEESEVIRI